MSTRYHRLARETPAHAWWKLPVAGLVAVAAYLGLTIGLVIVVAIGMMAAGEDGDSITRLLESADELDVRRPGVFAFSMAAVALMLPAVILAVLLVGPRPVGYLTSVEGRMRWGWLGRTTLVAFAVYGVVLAVALTVSEMTEPTEVRAPELDRTAVVALVLVLLMTPVQSAAEEYVFRGYLMQLVGSWTRFAAIPVLVSVPLFAAGHTYNLWGLVDVAIFGLTAACLTIRTGGLEAAIAAHTANNVVLMVAEALGVFRATDEGAGPVDLLPTIVSSVVMLLVVSWLATRLGIVRTRAPIEPPAPPPLPMWPPPPYAYVPWPPQTYLPPQWAQPQPAPVAPPVPVGPPAMHPRTPDYPGELPPDWR